MSLALEIRGPGTGPLPGRPPLLLIPGLGHEAGCWDRWSAAARSAGFPAYALSLRGHGASPGRLSTARMGQYRDDVIEVVRSLPEAPVLVGHSMGGLVATMVAAKIPVRGLVLVASVPGRPGVGPFLSVARQHPLDALGMFIGQTLPLRREYLFEKLDAETAATFLADCGKESPIAQTQIVFHRPPANPVGDPPILSLGATADRLVPIRDVRATARRYGGDLVEFDEIGHNLMQDVGWEKPWAVVEEWLGRRFAAA